MRDLFVSVMTLFILPAMFLPVHCVAQDYANRTLRVGTKPTPPFVLKTGDSLWSGISIDLWRRMAGDLQLTYEFEERDLTGLLRGLEDGTLDLSVAAITVTADREARIDFTHPFYSTGLCIAVSPQSRKGWVSALEGFVSFRFLQVVAALGLLLLGVGVLIWLFERKKNADEFGTGVASGIGSGFWWSAVTMTTVGYGDKAPRTVLGRLLGLVWMFAGIIVISGFTAAITSALTISRMEYKISGPGDLPKVNVGTVQNTSSAEYLRNQHIDYEGYETPREGLRAVSDGVIDAMVYDEPILEYLVETEFKGEVIILPGTFERQDYSIGLPSESSLREPLNRSLLHIVSQPEWNNVLQRYLGKSH